MQLWVETFRSIWLKGAARRAVYMFLPGPGQRFLRGRPFALCVWFSSYYLAVNTKLLSFCPTRNRFLCTVFLHGDLAATFADMFPWLPGTVFIWQEVAYPLCLQGGAYVLCLILLKIQFHVIAFILTLLVSWLEWMSIIVQPKTLDQFLRQDLDVLLSCLSGLQGSGSFP